MQNTSIHSQYFRIQIIVDLPEPYLSISQYIARSNNPFLRLSCSMSPLKSSLHPLPRQNQGNYVLINITLSGLNITSNGRQNIQIAVTP